jgi:hypothetical protein
LISPACAEMCLNLTPGNIGAMFDAIKQFTKEKVMA